MNRIKESTQALIEKYRSELSQKGLEIVIGKRYFENNVSERWSSTGSGSILNQIDRARDRKKEKKNRYNYVKNRYHCIVISVTPTDKSILRREDCGDYAFIFKKAERSHIGEKPLKTVYEENKILKKIEKRIAKILKKAEKMPPQKVCVNSVFDAIRYIIMIRYRYKKCFLGKPRYIWEIICLALFCLLALGFFFMTRLISS